jgi:lipopolysaccharide biosynthesis regulator YciM
MNDRRIHRDPYVMALDRLAAGDRSSAFEFLKKAVAVDSDNVDAYIRLGTLLRQRGETKRAVQIHREQTVRPDLTSGEKSSLYENLTLDYREYGDLESALSWAQENVKVDRTNPRAWHLLATVYEERDQWDEAFDTHVKRLRTEARKDDYFLAIHRAEAGRRLFASGDTGRAKEYFKKALRLDGGCAPALIGLGELHYNQKDLKRAIKTWTRLFEQNPRYAWLVFDRVEEAYFEKGIYDRIVNLYGDLVQRIPDDVCARIALAKIYQKMGELPKAIEVCQSAFEYEPDSRDVRRALAFLYYQDKNYRKAAEQLLEHELAGRPALLHFTCSNCSYRSSEPLWRCPKCSRWKTFFDESARAAAQVQAG